MQYWGVKKGKHALYNIIEVTDNAEILLAVFG